MDQQGAAEPGITEDRSLCQQEKVVELALASYTAYAQVGIRPIVQFTDPETKNELAFTASCSVD